MQLIVFLKTSVGLYNNIFAFPLQCPKCNICIEKNGGCNHMQCYHCKHDFCWMCLGDWKTHGSEYYECSRYKENPNIAHESAHAQAREALKKYLHYFERVRIFVRGSRALPIFGTTKRNGFSTNAQARFFVSCS